MSNRQINELAIALPFSVDEYGTIAATVTPSKIWGDRARSVIGTAVRERVMRPDFGCEATLSVFEPEESAMAILEEDIRRAFDEFLPLCTISSLNVSIDEYTRVISAEVVYNIPGSQDFFLNVGIATLNGTDPISEDSIWQPL